MFYACRRGGSLCHGLSTENHRHMFHEIQVQPSLWASGEYDVIPGSAPEDEIDVEMRTITLSWLTKLVWLLYNVASSACIMVSLVFWIVLFPMFTMSGTELMINIQLHAVTSVIILLEMCVSAIPIRLFHYVYSLGYGVIYVVFSGFYYAEDHRHILYPLVLDWSKPGTTVLAMVLLAFVGLPLIQLALFGIYKLKLFIYDKCCPEQL